MPGHVCEPVKRGVRRVALAPLQIPKTIYQQFMERRQLAQEAERIRRHIATQTGEDLAELHESIWSQFPEVAQHVRQYVRKEHNDHGKPGAQ